MPMHTLGVHQSTYDSIFQHPLARNLQWRDVRLMLAALSETTEERSGSFKFMRNGRTLTVHPPKRKDFDDIQELMQIRHFLDSSGEPVHTPVAAAMPGRHLLVVIDHRMARIYQTELHGSVPERIVPYDAAGFGRHLHHVEDHGDGQRKPEQRSFYDAVARTLQGAEEILVFGSGTGASSAMNQLCAWLARRHADLARRVVGSIVVDEHHLTEDQLLAQARAFYEGLEMHETRSLC